MQMRSPNLPIESTYIITTRQMTSFSCSAPFIDYIIFTIPLSVFRRCNAGTPLARISHRKLIDKLYAFLTAFLQLRYALSVMSMRSL